MKDYIDSTDYADIKKMKRYYVDYQSLECKAVMGDFDAADLKMDLDTGLKTLDEEEMMIMKERYLEGHSSFEKLELDLGKSIKWIRLREERAIFKISHYLSTGMKLSTSQAKKEILNLKKEKRNGKK